MFDEKKAEKAIRFIQRLKHTKGKWKGVKFDLLDWQRQAISDVFGTVRDNGYRQYNTAYLEVPKKNGKSELGAGVALLCLCSDDEWAAEIYGCAADRAQASIIFDVACAMVEQDSLLSKHIKIIPSMKRLVYMPTKSFYQVLSAEAYTKHGLNVHACIFDELHAQPNRNLYDVMTDGAGDARTQPLTFCITTAGDDPDRNSIGWEVHQMAQDILMGVKEDPTFFGMIYGLDKDNKRVWKGREHESLKQLEEDDWERIWRDPEVWKQINPSLGHTIDMVKVEDMYVRAKDNLAKEKNFRWLRLNSWEKIKLTKWLSLDFWDLCKGKIDIERLIKRPCYGGLDLSSTLDLTAFVLLFPPDDINKNWVVLPWFWAPEENARERSRVDKVPYETWYKQGHIQLTQGNVIDYNFIRKEIEEASKKFNLIQVGYDPHSAMETALYLANIGIEMVEVRQGAMTMSSPMKKIEEITRKKELIHGGQPVLRWNVGNVEIEVDKNDNIRPVKGKSFDRIDGLVAMINAMDRAMRMEKKPTSPYEDPDYVTEVM